MKTFLSLLLFSLTLSFGPAAETAGPDPVAIYQCPMHPWIKADRAGAKCTICGMELAAAPTGGGAASNDPNLVTLTPASATVVGVRTDAARRGPLVRTLRVNGVVEDDDTRHRILAARVPGRVEKLGVNYVGAEVEEGAPLATIYSPEMLTAQRQFVERIKAGSVVFSASDRAAARERLLELGLTAEEINILEHTLEPVAMVQVRAPMSGTVVSRAVYEGQYVQTNDRLFEIGDFSSMWFVFDAYEPDLAWLRPGLDVAVSVASLPGRTVTAPIAFIDPNFNEQTRTAKVRVILPNRDRVFLHKQTGLAHVQLEVPDVLLVPRSAVLQHGAEPVVFLEQSDHAYLARRVRLGRVGDATVEILEGLQAGDRVVTEGGLILDGQAQLARAAITGEISAHDHAAVVKTSAPGAAGGTSTEQLRALALAAADAAALLAADDFPAYQKHLPLFRAALEAFLDAETKAGRSTPLDKFKAGLPARPDLRGARRDFEPLSTALADLVRGQHLAQPGNLHVFQCPMSPVLGTGRWLARTTSVRNPFFGSAMLECGEELR
jgi:membrane fusion protein, copper/silver efflux system